MARTLHDITGLVIEPIASALHRRSDTAETVARLVNDVYAVAEDGMWVAGAARTSAADIADPANAEQIFVARAGERTVGCIRVVQLDDHVAEFGMLATDAQVRSAGIGRSLVEFAERHAAQLGNGTMQLEVIRPREYSMPSKEFLDQWYTRLGYRPCGTHLPEAAHPELVSAMQVPCVVVTYRKDLRP